jgi:hypothetical protein
VDISSVTEDYFNNKLLTYAQQHFTACKHDDDATVFEERIRISCQAESNKSISLRKGEATITIICRGVVAVESSEPQD